MLLYQKEKTQPRVTHTILTDVQDEVLTVAEAKSFMGIDYPDFDTLIGMLISAAREEAEKYTGLSIGIRQIKLKGDYLDESVYMPYAPYEVPDIEGLQTVGYDAQTVPADIKLALLNMVHIAFDNRADGLNFGTSLKLLDKSRRRVGL